MICSSSDIIHNGHNFILTVSHAHGIGGVYSVEKHLLVCMV